MTSLRVSALTATCLAACSLAIGITIGGRLPAVRSLPPAFAVTSQSDGAFAVCTAPLEVGVEGFFVLDFMTGDLSGGILGQNSKFVGGYKHNVLKDLEFKPGQAKNPRFLLVSGMVEGVRRRAGLAQSVLYVTDTDTGTTAAYAIPWNQQAQSGTPFMAGLELLDVARPRGGGAKAP